MSAPFRRGEQVARVVQPVDVVAGFGEQVRVPSLPARAIQNARGDGKLQDLDEPSDLAAVALQVEERLVLDEILRVEVRLPPIRGRRREDGGGRPRTTASFLRPPSAFLSQKKTGSR
jgi:hypothetical protein